MPLFIVATPIGNPEDITLRAIKLIRECDLLIGEERKPTSQLLKALGVQKPIELLNEHSDSQDVEFLLGECRSKNVVLVSDAGTPSFQDPGFLLVNSCRSENITVTSAPGASSLMSLLSMSSHDIREFYFAGFLPQDSEAQSKK
ncbi:MAG: methyltransferase, partial [Bdellovibrionales bacterium]|nr:methyltransferase [Bdellovibrionales bacterium]